MEITSYQHVSMIDFPGMVASVVFVPGCNYKCPSCHAKHIIFGKEKINEEEIFSYIDSHREWIDGVVLCGGEPTLQPLSELEHFFRRVKSRKKLVKLDTNGSNPGVLEQLLGKKLIDYVALDVKAPPELYNIVTGVKANLEDIQRSMKILFAEKQKRKDFDYELRTTVVPGYVGGVPRWLNVQEVGEIAKFIKETTGNKNEKYILQEFVARDKVDGTMLDERFTKQSLPEKYWQTPKTLLEDMKQEAVKYLPETVIR